MKTINVFEMTGSFAENKDVARNIRIAHILPIVNEQEVVTIDFSNVENATQSFIHALISDVIRRKGVDVLDLLIFKGCNSTVRTLIEIVTEYMQDGAELYKSKNGTSKK